MAKRLLSETSFRVVCFERAFCDLRNDGPQESWSRSSEQDSAKAKWTAAGVGPLQFRARGVTEGGRSPTRRHVLRAAENSCRRREGRWCEVGLVRRAPVKAHMGRFGSRGSVAHWPNPGGCVGIQGLSLFRRTGCFLARSNSHSVAARDGCTNIPLAAVGLRKTGPFSNAAFQAKS